MEYNILYLMIVTVSPLVRGVLLFRSSLPHVITWTFSQSLAGDPWTVFSSEEAWL